MNTRNSYWFSLPAVLLLAASLNAGIVVTAYSPDVHSVDTAKMDADLGIVGYTIEDFADDVFIDGLSMTTGHLEDCDAGSRNWDDPWMWRVEEQVTFEFSPAFPGIGIGLGDFDRDATYRVGVNGGPVIDLGTFAELQLGDAFPSMRNGYLMFEADGGNAISSLSFSSTWDGDFIWFDHLAVPEPGALCLLLIGGTAVWRRRRR